MKKRLLFIFNPKSGKAQIKNKLYEIIDTFVKGGYEVVAHPTQGIGDAHEKTKELAPEMDLVVCSGGDGTLDEVVSGLMECKERIPLGYIPAGSTNDFANSLEISKDMVKAISAPEKIPGMIWGTMTEVRAFQGVAPRSIAASARLGSRERILGMTLRIT